MHEGFERVGVIGEGVVVAGDALNPDGGHKAQPFTCGWNSGRRKGGCGAHQINHNQNITDVVVVYFNIRETENISDIFIAMFSQSFTFKLKMSAISVTVTFN